MEKKKVATLRYVMCGYQNQIPVYPPLAMGAGVPKNWGVCNQLKGTSIIVSR